MSTPVEQIKERLDIVDVISGYLKLQKTGMNYKARCPFHNEKSGSFFVSPERQIWHCFGCSLGGDVFGFVKQIEGIEFPEALRILAAKAGVKLEHHTPEYQQFQSAKNTLHDIVELATKFFEKQLHESQTGKHAKGYLLKRGLTEDSIKNFRLGFAPDSWGALLEFLERRYSTKDIFDSGLTVHKEADLPGHGRYYDRFRSRIMFPVADLNGQVVGFSGRVFALAPGREVGQAATKENEDKVGAKYINTPQTAIYDKSRVLYGLDRARMDIRRDNKCLVMEGNMDVIMSHQAGATNAVASSGTALTDGHLKIIKRYTDNLDLCFDADAAGTIATERGVDLALAKGFNVGIITVDEPDLKDPADYVKRHGSLWAEHVKKSRPFMEYYFEAAKKSLDISTALGKKLMAQKLTPFLASMANDIERAHWVGELALALKLDEKILYSQIVAVKPREAEEEKPAAVTAKPEQVPLGIYEEELLALLMKRVELSQSIDSESQSYLSEQFRTLLAHLNHDGAAINKLVDGVDPKLAMSAEFAYLRAQEEWQGVEDAKLESEFKKCLYRIERQKIDSRLNDLTYRIRQAEKNQDKNARDLLRMESVELYPKKLELDKKLAELA